MSKKIVKGSSEHKKLIQRLSYVRERIIEIKEERARLVAERAELKAQLEGIAKEA